MQESRLFKILYCLLEKGRATAPELAAKFEVSTRTIYRDIDALSEAGIPLYTEAGRNGGICLMDHFVLDRIVLTDGEKKEILSALQSAGAAGTGGEKSAFEKLSALFRMQSDNWYEMDFSRWGCQSGDNEKFELLKKAVLSHRQVEILYAGAGREKKQRTIWPLKLSYKSNAWYLKAWCMTKEDFRLFKLNRILEWRLLEETFTPEELLRSPGISDSAAVSVPHEIPGSAVERPSAASRAVSPEPPSAASCAAAAGLPPLVGFPLPEEPPEIVLSFPEEMSYRVYDEFSRSQIEELEDGSLRVTAPMPADEWLIGFLLSFGAGVEVIEPVYLKKILAERAMEIYQKNYKT